MSLQAHPRYDLQAPKESCRWMSCTECSSRLALRTSLAAFLLGHAFGSWRTLTIAIGYKSETGTV
jgi:hypothetical protein